MARAHFSDVAINASGGRIQNARIEVFARGTSTYAEIYGSEAIITAMTNPYTSPDGVVSHWAEAGAYTVVITDPSGATTQRSIGWSAVPGVVGGIPGSMLTDGGVSNTKLATGIDGAKLIAGSVVESHLGSAVATKLVNTGLLSARPAIGSVPSGYVYLARHPSAANRTEGHSWWVASGGAWVLAGQHRSVIYDAAAFPSGSDQIFDGREVQWAVSGNPLQYWTFSYNSADSTRPWGFVGGAPSSAYINLNGSTVPTGDNQWTATGVTLTVPKAGVYEARWRLAGQEVLGGAQNVDIASGIYFAGALVSEHLEAWARTPAISYAKWMTSGERRLTLATSGTLEVRWQVSGTNFNAYRAYGTGLTLVPVRLTP